MQIEEKIRDKKYLQELDLLTEDKKCFCGWWKLGDCIHCGDHLTLAMRAKYKNRRNTVRSEICRCAGRFFI